MLLPSKLRLDFHTLQPSFKLRPHHTRVKSSVSPHQLLLQLLELRDHRLLLTEEMDKEIWELFTEKRDGKHGLKT